MNTENVCVCVCVCVCIHTYTRTCHTTEYFSAIEKKEILPFGEIQKDPKDTVVSEISQKPYDPTYMWNIFKSSPKQTNQNM